MSDYEKLIAELRQLAVAEGYGLKTTRRPWHLHKGDLLPDTNFLLFAVNHIEEFANAIEALQGEVNRLNELLLNGERNYNSEVARLTEELRQAEAAISNLSRMRRDMRHWAWPTPPKR